MKFEIGQHVYINSWARTLAFGKVVDRFDNSADGGFYEGADTEVHYAVELISYYNNPQGTPRPAAEGDVVGSVPERWLRAEDSLTQLARSVVEEAAE